MNPGIGWGVGRGVAIVAGPAIGNTGGLNISFEYAGGIAGTKAGVNIGGTISQGGLGAGAGVGFGLGAGAAITLGYEFALVAF
jgi:hypothetical protein